MDRCLTPDEFEQYASGCMNGEALSHFEQHLATCQRCKAVWELFSTDNQALGDVRKLLGFPGPEETSHAPSGPPRERDETASRAPSPDDSGSSSRRAHRSGFPNIKGYQIQRIIGRGGMGVVYEAIQEKLNRPVALKLLPALVSVAHPEFVARFRREAATAAKLHHTHIVPIYDFGESREGYFYAMELLDGQPLSNVIKRLATMDLHRAPPTALAALLSGGEATSDDGNDVDAVASQPSSSSTGSSTGSKGRVYYRQAASWIADVADALQYAHLQGMVHRDIKPSNLMLCTDGRMMVLDFGLVKTTEDQSVTATGSLAGTYRYMSPEQIGAKRIPIDARSDVYSLGVTLYELLTFQPAFAATEQSELLSQVLFKEPVAPRKVVSSVPVDLQTICLKAMEKAPHERYQSAKAMADDLRSYLLDLPIVARPQGAMRRVMKLVRRRRIETVAVVALCLLIVATTLGIRSCQHAQDATQREQDAVRRDLIKRAVEHWKQQEWGPAKLVFTGLIDENPEDYPALVNLANVHKDEYYACWDESLLDKADELLNRAILVEPDRCEAWNARGALYQAWNRPLDAISAYEKALEFDDSPYAYAIWVSLGIVYAIEGDLDRAEECVQTGIQLLEEAEIDPETATETDAETVMPWRILAAVQLQAGCSETLQTLVTARANSNNRDPRTLLVYAEYHLGQLGQESARQARDLALAANVIIAPVGPDALDRGERGELLARAKRILALAELRNGHWDAAAEAANEAIAAEDEPAYAQLILAVAAGHLGDVTAAREHVRLAEAAWPEELKQAEFRATQDGYSLWFDTAAELEALREQARKLIGEPVDQP